MKKEKGKIITVTSSKGGVGKTVFLLNLAGIYASKEKKVLIIDADLGNGAISLNLNLEPDKTIYHLIEDIKILNYRSSSDYIINYTSNIGVISSCKDPRQINKTDVKFLNSFLEEVVYQYDVILIDTTHGLNKTNVLLIDYANTVLHVFTNDFMDIKNTKSYISVMQSIDDDKTKLVLNNSRDPYLNYFSNFDIKNLIKANIDYTISSSLHMKNITSFILEGKIFTLNNNLVFKDKKDMKKLVSMAEELLIDEEVYYD